MWVQLKHAAETDLFIFNVYYASKRGNGWFAYI